jgi:hypothetical protein
LLFSFLLLLSPSVIMIRILFVIFPKQHQLSASPRTPPRNTEIRTFNIHLTIAQRIPESFDAGTSLMSVLDGVDQMGC